MNDPGTSPPHGAPPLLEAMRLFLPAEMWAEYDRATEARKNPLGWPGASSNHEHYLRTRRVQRAWYVIVAAMKLKFETGTLRAFGREDPPFGLWCAIPTPAWRTLRITNGENGVASMGPKKIFNIYDIHVLPPDDDDLVPTGTPGRPGKGINIVRLEFERRVIANELEASLAAECLALADWYYQKYPQRDSPSPKTIANNIRYDYKAAKARLRTAKQKSATEVAG